MLLTLGSVYLQFSTAHDQYLGSQYRWWCPTQTRQVQHVTEIVSRLPLHSTTMVLDEVSVAAAQNSDERATSEACAGSGINSIVVRTNGSKGRFPLPAIPAH